MRSLWRTCWHIDIPNAKKVIKQLFTRKAQSDPKTTKFARRKRDAHPVTDHKEFKDKAAEKEKVNSVAQEITETVKKVSARSTWDIG